MGLEIDLPLNELRATLVSLQEKPAQVVSAVGWIPVWFSLSNGSHHNQVAILVPDDKLDRFRQLQNFFPGQKLFSFSSGTSAAT